MLGQDVEFINDAGEVSPLTIDQIQLLADAGYDPASMTGDQQIAALRDLPIYGTVSATWEVSYEATGNPISDEEFLRQLRYGRKDWRAYDLTDEQLRYLSNTADATGVDRPADYIPSTVTGSSVKVSDVINLIRAGTDLTRAIVIATSDVPVGGYVTSPRTLPYPAQVQLPNGQTVFLPTGANLPVGSQVIRTATPAEVSQRSGVFGGGNGMVFLALGAVGVLALSQRRRSG